MARCCLEDRPQLRAQLLAAIPTLLAMAAFACSYVGNFWCDNIVFEANLSDTNFAADAFYRPRDRSYGLWFYRWQETSLQTDGSYVYREGCVNYEKGHPDWSYDAKWRTARAFSCIAIIIGGWTVFCQICAPFLLFDQKYWRCAMVFFAFIAFCQGLTLFFLDSIACQDNPLLLYQVEQRSLYPETCAWSWGTYCCVAGVALWFTTIVSMLLIPAPGAHLAQQPFPMMIWSHSDDESEGDSDDESDDDDDDDGLDKESDSTADEETGHYVDDEDNEEETSAVSEQR